MGSGMESNTQQASTSHSGVQSKLGVVHVRVKAGGRVMADEAGGSRLASGGVERLTSHGDRRAGC